MGALAVPYFMFQQEITFTETDAFIVIILLQQIILQAYCLYFSVHLNTETYRSCSLWISQT